MAKKKSSKAKKSPPKKKCKGKCVNNNCDTSSKELSRVDVITKTKKNTGYLFGLIKRIFGYE